MKINSQINRYIFKELLIPFWINLFFFLFIFLMTKLLDITNYIVNYHVNFKTIFWILLFAIPSFLQFVIPMAIMMAVLLTFLRLSGDNEIVALKSCGVSIYRLLPPVLLFCLMGCLLTGWITIYGSPWGMVALKRMTAELAGANFQVALKERTFNDNLKGVMFYVNKIDLKNNMLKDIFIEDQRNIDMVNTIIAPKGVLINDPEGKKSYLKLYKGMIHQVSLKEKTVNIIRFDSYDLKLDLGRKIASKKQKKKHRREMSLKEMNAWLKNRKEKNSIYYRTLMDWHKKFSIPIACLAMGVLAMPLGIQPLTAKRSFGIGLGIILFLIYYVLLTVGWSLGKSGAYPPIIGMWLPDVLMGGLGIYLLRQSANERPGLFNRFMNSSK